jgi:hypothetical protein
MSTLRGQAFRENENNFSKHYLPHYGVEKNENSVEVLRKHAWMNEMKKINKWELNSFSLFHPVVLAEPEPHIIIICCDKTKDVHTVCGQPHIFSSSLIY